MDRSLLGAALYGAGAIFPMLYCFSFDFREWLSVVDTYSLGFVLLAASFASIGFGARMALLNERKEKERRLGERTG